MKKLSVLFYSILPTILLVLCFTDPTIQWTVGTSLLIGLPCTTSYVLAVLFYDLEKRKNRHIGPRVGVARDGKVWLTNNTGKVIMIYKPKKRRRRV